MRLALLPFVNSAPYFHNLDRDWLKRQEVHSHPPRALGQLGREGKVDAGIFSLVDSWALERKDLFEPLSSLGISAFGPIASILLFGVENPLDLEGQAIAITPDTATSSCLLHVWLSQYVGIKKWKPVALGEMSAAALLIGDQALARSLTLSKVDSPPLDLCQQWSHWTGLPFVFARWCVRKDLPEEEKKELLSQVEGSLDKSLADLDGLVEELFGKTGFPRPFLAKYIQGIRYRLGPEEKKGMDLFKIKLGKEGDKCPV